MYIHLYICTYIHTCMGYCILYIYVLPPLYPFPCQWTFRVHPCVGYCKQHGIEVHAFFWTMFFSGYMAKGGIAGSYGSFISSVLTHLHSVLHSDCTVYVLNNNVREFPFLHTLSSIYSS